MDVFACRADVRHKGFELFLAAGEDLQVFGIRYRRCHSTAQELYKRLIFRVDFFAGAFGADEILQVRLLGILQDGEEFLVVPLDVPRAAEIYAEQDVEQQAHYRNGCDEQDPDKFLGGALFIGEYDDHRSRQYEQEENGQYGRKTQ
jgi:hypothetical protein